MNEWLNIFYNNLGIYNSIISRNLSVTYNSEPLGKHIKIIGGYSFKSNSYKIRGIPVIRISDFQNEKIDLSSAKYYDDSPDLQNYELVAGDIIIAMTGGTIGKLAIVQSGLGKLYLNQRVGKFKVLNPDEFEYEYVYWIARGVESKIKELAWGAAIPNVSGKQIESLNFIIPPKNKQSRIVSFLNDLRDNKIKGEDYFDVKTEKEIIQIQKSSVNKILISIESKHQLDLLKKLRQQILQDAVEGKLVLQDPSDETASRLLERIKAEKEQLIREKKIKKDKPLPEIKPEEIPFEIPENWVWGRLGDITNYGSSPKAEPSDINNETWVLDLEDIEKETSRLLCKIRFSERQSLSTKSVFKQGEVLYSKLRPYLDKVLVADEDGVCTTEILPLQCYSNLNPYYLRIALKRKDFLLYVNSVTKGMKMPRLGTPEGKSALIPISPVNEQQRIFIKVEQLMNLCDEMEQSIQQNQKYTQELLQVALKEALEPKTN